MAKLKSPTPQELYRARKQREEREKTAFLPPGLYNHGNTCFMNSVLQGLIATRLLSDLVHFAPIPPSVQLHSATVLAPRRSPQLTNGHNLAGPFEQNWMDTMPIGDVFLSVMYRAWELQRLRRRESLSPKSLLGALGQKYDQYLDFAQQDAHEFLRILLDAMRMEEHDVIKKRQPPPLPKDQKKRRRTTIIPSSPPPLSPQVELADQVSPPLSSIPEEEKLMSLADMIFGGKLTSILVCQKCKHVSQTYEEFNDISLSIKPEDYAHERKRDRLKNLAKRLTSFPTSPSPGVGLQRSSSVPPSPREREEGQLVGQHELPTQDAPRRRSLDIAQDQEVGSAEQSTRTSKEEEATVESEGSHVLVNGVMTADEKRVEFAGPTMEKKEKKVKKDDDGWAKLGRRISMSVGLGKGSKEKEKEKEKERKSRPRERGSRELVRPPVEPTEDRPSSESTTDAPNYIPDIVEHRHSHTPEIRLSRPSSSPQRGKSDIKTSDSRPPSTPPSMHNDSFPRFPNMQRAKSPKPPKPSTAETEYLRRILADVSAGPSPFALFKPGHHLYGDRARPFSPGSSSPSMQSVWLNMAQLSGIEECLRMFTSVEIMDGENMVGCRRCWKIANGVYTAPPKGDVEGLDEDSDSVDHSTIYEGHIAEEQDQARQKLSPLAPPTPHIPTSMSTPTVSFFSHPNISDTPSVSSLPDIIATEPSVEPKTFTSPTNPGRSPRIQVAGSVPIPLTSTTAPESPLASTPSTARPRFAIDRTNSMDSGVSFTSSQGSGARSTPISPTSSSPPSSRLGQVASHLPPSVSRDSLIIPRIKRQRLKADTDSTDDSSGAESETSVATSIDSSTSVATPATSTNGHLSGVPKSPLSPQSKKTSRPKPVIMRPAYKRYLIATPPPVLVIHLKRFQQISKTHLLSFSHGFRKLDDYVTFPEHLDLTPFLAPKKEDFGLGKKGKAKSHRLRPKDADRCMYRLYAVVVHIGNMLGGHYIAYTALPAPADIKPESPGSGPEFGPAPMKPERQWAYISDTIVQLTTLEEVLKAKAYICMYERI